MAQVSLSVGSGDGAFLLGFWITLGVETSSSSLSGWKNLIIGGLFGYNEINGLLSRVVKKDSASLLISLSHFVNPSSADPSILFFLVFALGPTASDILAFEIIFDSHFFSSKANCSSSSRYQNSPNSGWLFLLEIISNSHFFSFKANFSLFLEDQNSSILALASLLRLLSYAKPSSKFISFEMCTFFVSRL